MNNVKQLDSEECTLFSGSNMRVSIYRDRDLMGKAAAADVAERIKMLQNKQPEINLVFAAAPSQSEFLHYLTRSEGIDWERINAFHMDEYIGLREDAPQRFGNFLKKHIFGLLPFKNIYYIDGNVTPVEKEATRYEALLRNHPIDLVLMGIGENGHIAFNDPPVADFNDPLWVKEVELDMACRTQQVNDKCFEELDQVPLHALTLTVPALMSGQYLYCIVPSVLKARAVSQALNGPVTKSCPASILRRHPKVNMYLDRDSASLLNLQTEKQYVS